MKKIPGTSHPGTVILVLTILVVARIRELTVVVAALAAVTAVVVAVAAVVAVAEAVD